MASPFSSVRSVNVKRSIFNLSYEKKFTADFAYLYPVMCDEVVPGDVFKIGASSVIRFNPLVAPIMHQVTAKAYYFFIPYRIIDDNWEEIITGGINGTSTKAPPTWPTTAVPGRSFNIDTGGSSVANSSLNGTLWDYLGFPTDFTLSYYPGSPVKPIDYPRRAYYVTWAHYFADFNWFPSSMALWISYAPSAGWISDDLMHRNVNWLSPALEPSYSFFSAGHMNGLLWASWQKDYFSSALRSQQRGITPAIPISGTLPVNFSNSWTVPLSGIPLMTQQAILQAIGTSSSTQVYSYESAGADSAFRLQVHGQGVPSNTPLIVPALNGSINNASTSIPAANMLGASVNLSNAVTFNVSDLRTAFQIQKWLERNSRSGVRYTEFLRAHFAVAPRDERLDRPEYIGGCTMPIVTSEVLQTSSTDSTSPQANMAGHGISVGGNFIGTYRATEYGLILGLLTIRPKPAYEDRLDRQWIKPTRYDFYFPEFQSLSEQGIYHAELRYRATPSDSMIFGFQGRYSEMRFKHDMVCGLFRQSAPNNLSFWHMARHWPADISPVYAQSFLCTGFNTPSGAKRVLAAPSQPAFLVNWCNHIKAVRPLPFEADPGYIDHY